MRASIVVPTYERPAKLQAAVDRLCSQTVDDYEVLLVDDGSESDAQDRVLTRAAERDRVTVLRQSGGGPAAARNAGWRAADGEFVCFTDDDCLVPDDWIERLLAAFEPDVAAVGGTLRPVETKLGSNPFARAHRLRDRVEYDEPDERTRDDTGVNVGGTANVAYRRQVLAELDGFDESFPLAAGEDADLQHRAVSAGHEMVFVTVCVRHNDDYEWQSFVERAVRSGRGTRRFHEKHGERRSPARILLGLVGSVVFLPRAFARSRDPVVAVLYVLERVLNRVGELQSVLDERSTARS